MIVRKFRFEAGVAVRGAVKEALKSAAFDYGVDLKLDEGSGWISRTIYCTVSGEARAVEAYLSSVQRYFKQLEETDE